MTQTQMTAYLADKIGISKGQSKSALDEFNISSRRPRIVHYRRLFCHPRDFFTDYGRSDLADTLTFTGPFNVDSQ
jgi:hypothetical protein